MAGMRGLFIRVLQYNSLLHLLSFYSISIQDCQRRSSRHAKAAAVVPSATLHAKKMYMATRTRS